jgi:hypothetical protein
MADFNFKPIGTEVRPVQGASIGDMINIARGAQQYQQAQQINPLELQQKQQIVEQASKINPLAFQQQQQATRTGEIALGVEEQKNIERQNMQTFFSDPNNFQTDGRIDINKINAQVPKIAPLTGPDYVRNITTLSTAQTEALKAKQNLTQDQRQLVASTLSLLGRAGVNDPQVVIKELRMLSDQNPDNLDLKKLIENSYVPIFGGMQPGANVADSLIKAGQSILTPTQQQSQLTPTISTTESGRTVLTTPGIGAAPPTAAFGVAGGMQVPAQPSVAGPVGAGAEVAPGMRVPYPVRRADQPYMAEPTEVKDQASGQEYRTRLVNAQGDLPTGRRNVEEVIKQANVLNENLYDIEKGGGIIGQVGRKIRMAINSADYDILAKDLAKLALSNASAMGGAGNTVSGLDMQQVANGTIKMPPEKLVEIARRVQSDQTNLDLQAKGAQQFAQRFGDNNMKAYQQAWNANADSKVFEAMNIVRFISDPAKQKTELNRLFPDASQYKEFLTKYQNIKKLSESGSL